MKKYKFCIFVISTLMIILLSEIPVYAVDVSKPRAGEEVTDNDLSKAIASQGKDALKMEVSHIGGSVVNAARTLFITFFALAVLFMGLQAAGGGLRDPRKIELIKGGGISAAVSAVLVYKAEAIVSFVLSLVGVDVNSLLK
ncbi:MAG: hypothetical protein HGA27_03730 [Peptococcaceae bacterium]|nr:hypothetical protein [Peptococcaceae bacterium]